MIQKNVIVVDLDGTLCNHSEREHLAIAGEWDEFHSLLKGDVPWPEVQNIISTLSSNGYQVIGLTGRNEKWRIITWEWLYKYNIALDALLMRPDDDYTPDVELKPKMLNQFFEDVFSSSALDCVLVILEDRDKVVVKWRDLGFTCWQVRSNGT